MKQPYTEQQIREALDRLDGWARREDHITRTFRFRDFAQAMEFVNRVAAEAEAADHHPDIDIRWNAVTLALSTHSAGGLTDKDFHLANRINAAATPAL